MTYTEWNTHMFDIREYWVLKASGREMTQAVAAWTSRYGTDGYISRSDFKEVARFRNLKPNKVARRMIDAGLLIEEERGYQLVVEAGTGRDNFLYCPTIASPLFRFRPSAHQAGSRRRIPDSVRKYVIDRDGHACVNCGATENLAMDHIVPWSRGGPDRSTNLQTLCGSCNSRKSDREP